MKPLIVLLMACHGSVAVAAEGPAAAGRANRLAKEKSPYLLQHAHNPVDWYPWGDEAFAKAAKENKPVLLSIGYATCHWCHVMERESFQDAAVAKELNDHFVAIKLDREERPDLDHVYMAAMQGMGMGGGWPLNVFLTPDRKPFFGGTYFPPKAKGGQPGFPDVLERIRTLWKEKEKEIRNNADQLTSELTRLMTAAPAAAPGAKSPSSTAVSAAAKSFLKEYDAKNGGFGAAPKFPQPQVLGVVLRHGVQSAEKEAVQAVRQTLLKMAHGGITDQLGGGIARYSTDAEWLVPHFEKMLYDNAQVASVALDAYTATGDEKLAAFARSIFSYVLRDMTSNDGAFYSAEDADSEGHEGKFYTWTKAEIEKLLSAEEAKLAIIYWGVTEKGNFVDHSHPNPEAGQNILSVVDPARKLAAVESTLLESARKKMFEARARRVRPLRDDKVLASWNGLMLSALARAGGVLGEPAYLAAAVKNATFIRSKMWDAESGTLAHRWREGEKDRVQLARSYAFLLEGVLDLYQATLDPRWLQWALDLANSMTRRFYDAANGGFYQGEAESDVLVRVKEDYDDVEPSGNSAGVMALLRLSALTDQPKWREQAEKTLQFFAPKLAESPASLPLMSQAAANASSAPFRVVLAGETQAPVMSALHRAALAVYQPNKVVLGTAAPAEEFARTLPARDGKPTAYVCSGTFCYPATHDPATVREHLKAPPPGKSEIQNPKSEINSDKR